MVCMVDYVSVLIILSFSGYGWITPQTPTGQKLCIFVCIVGIPITLLMLKSIGELITKWVNFIATKLEQKILKREEPKQVKTKSAAILLLLMVSLIVTNSLVVMYLEDWTFVEGIYFSFVTWSTIGFGDYLPLKKDKVPQSTRQLFVNTSKHYENQTTETNLKFLSGILIPLYVIVGLCIVSSVLNSIMAAIEERQCRFRCPRCISREIGDHVNSERYTIQELREHRVENEERYSEIEL